MSDLISRSALVGYIEEQIEESKEERSAAREREEASGIYFYSGEISAARRIRRYVNMFAPAVDAVEVVHGRNIRTAGRKYRDFHCSVCGAGVCNVEGGPLDGGFFNYCPNCGAKMDGGAEA